VSFVNDFPCRPDPLLEELLLGGLLLEGLAAGAAADGLFPCAIARPTAMIEKSNKVAVVTHFIKVLAPFPSLYELTQFLMATLGTVQLC
jgi:hypothetical protein